MWLRIAAVCGVVVIVCLLKGCGSAPQISSPNRKTLEALQTAVSARKVEWVDAVATQLAEKHQQKLISDAEFKAIDVVIKKAKAGEWNAALKDSFRLSDSQRPNSEDLAILKDRKKTRSSTTN